MIKNLSVQEFHNMIQKNADYTLLDVRRDDELLAAKYPEPFLHIELNDISSRLGEIPRDRPVVVACRSGVRSANAAAQLVGEGFKNVYNLTGGILAWTALMASIKRQDAKAS